MYSCKHGKNFSFPPCRKITSLLAGEALAGKWADTNFSSSTQPQSRGHPAVQVPGFHLNSPCPVVLGSLLSEKMSFLSVTVSGQVLNGNGFGSKGVPLRRIQETKSDLSSMRGWMPECDMTPADSWMPLPPICLCWDEPFLLAPAALPGQQGSGQEHRRGTRHGVTRLCSLLAPAPPHLPTLFQGLLPPRGLEAAPRALQFSSAVPQVSPWNHK